MTYTVDALFTKHIRIISERNDDFIQGKAFLPELIELLLELSSEVNLAGANLVRIRIVP